MKFRNGYLVPDDDPEGGPAPEERREPSVSMEELKANRAALGELARMMTAGPPRRHDPELPYPCACGERFRTIREHQRHSITHMPPHAAEFWRRKLGA